MAGVVLRGVLAVLAVFLAPMLYRDHFLALVLLRPTKEVLLASGFEVRQGELGLLEVYLAAVPLAVAGVWLSYLLGRAYSSELADGTELPGLAGRLLPAKRIDALCRVLEDKGTKVVFFGRLAVFPSSLLGAAAGVSGMPLASFLVADGLGALVSITEVVALGYLLSEAYDSAGPWVTAAGALVALGLLVALGRWLKREQRQSDG